MKCVSICAFFALTAAPLWASIDGTVVNGTTQKPQPGVTVTLVKPGQQGMQTIGTAVSDATGHFFFERDQPGGGPQLLQAAYKGVNYNKLMTPDIPTSNVELSVFEATKSPAVAHIAQHMLLVESTAASVTLSENAIIQNASTTTYENPAEGSFRFYVPPEAKGQVAVRGQGPQGMPLPLQAEPTETANVFKVNFPIKPGESQFEVDYTLPASSPTTLRGQVVGVKGMQAMSPLRLIAPAGVTLTGKDLQSVGTEPKTQATIYNVSASGAFSAVITGAGSLRAPEANAQDSEDSPPVAEGPPRVYRHLAWLLGLVFSILAVGLFYLFKMSPVRAPYAGK